jgi:tetratricopeptide (TPR) repeat protein
VDEAITCFRKAIDLDPKLANAHINLGVALKMQGKVDEAIACFRKALDLLPQGHPWRAGVTRQLQQSQLFQALEKKLLDVLAGKAKPASVAEQLQFAQLCQTTRRFAPAARFYAEAFETDAKQAADLQSDHRYTVADGEPTLYNDCRREERASGRIRPILKAHDHETDCLDSRAATGDPTTTQGNP